ncbi:MAG: DUF4157 domain-containing protein [Caulobacteraceae bacterium]
MEFAARNPALTGTRGPAAEPLRGRSVRQEGSADIGPGRLAQLAQLARNGPAAITQRAELQRMFGEAITQPQTAGPDLAVGAEDELQLKTAANEGQVQSAPPTGGAPTPGRLPGGLRSGIEALSGLSMAEVKVHYDSPKPMQLNAHAFAQGRDIHLGPGQERHLPHEAWHVVQQAQGRVQPTVQLKSGVTINDDASLEREADEMGGRATNMAPGDRVESSPGPEARISEASPVQAVMSVVDFQQGTLKRFRKPRKAVAQIDPLLATYIGARTVANANPLILALANYIGHSHNAARLAVATALRARVTEERDVLAVITPAHANVLDALIDTVGSPNVPQLIALANAVTAPNAPYLLPLISLVGVPNLGAASLLAVAAGAGAAHVPLLLTIIPKMGGFAQMATLAGLIAIPKTAADVFDLALVANGVGAEFARLAGDVPLFNDPAPAAPAAATANVIGARDNYNNTKANGYAAAVTAHIATIVAQGATMRDRASNYAGPLPLLVSVYNDLQAVNANLASLNAGAPFTMTFQQLTANALLLSNHLNNLRNWANARPVDATGHRTAILAAFATMQGAHGAFAAVLTPAGAAQRDLDTIEYPHYFERHTHHHFDFSDIKLLNTMWDRAWAAAPAGPLEGALVASINHLRTSATWLASGVPQPNLPTGIGGVSAHLIAYNTDAGKLRLGMYYPEPNGAPIFQYTDTAMRAIRKLK